MLKKLFDTSNYLAECDRPLPTEKNKRVIGLCGKIMKEFVALRPKTYSYLIDDG